ncbi:unnamed protein product [Microthlaspi erraticum]|uniref:Uncharacterized protein n=1 Tax=Microthlaspi erraticum TaxID=1685480 RepID=A0A6D2IE99_9BRAS|nr:unnamed protein product [Microthlaspi erraticum]CAA7051802.1 unnamed protein product [Microthlaspi erraticum]
MEKSSVERNRARRIEAVTHNRKDVDNEIHTRMVDSEIHTCRRLWRRPEKDMVDNEIHTCSGYGDDRKKTWWIMRSTHGVGYGDGRKKTWREDFTHGTSRRRDSDQRESPSNRRGCLPRRKNGATGDVKKTHIYDVKETLMVIKGRHQSNKRMLTSIYEKREQKTVRDNRRRRGEDSRGRR